MYAPVAGKVLQGDKHHPCNVDFHWLRGYSGFAVVILDNVPPSQDSSVLLDFVNNCLGGMQKDPARDDPNLVIKRKAAALRVSYAQERRLNNHTDQSVPAHGIPALLLVVNLCFFPQDTKHGAFR
ncbi:unnamed protein product [Symbiodinium sp. CCMP2456]|nr:unnamed protein product [Symbiodinium sp. CCMP2456]